MLAARLLLAVLVGALLSACASDRRAKGSAPLSSFTALDKDAAAAKQEQSPAEQSSAERTAPPPRVKVDVEFDGADASRITMPGYTRVVGDAKMVLNIGTLHAQGEVKLVPYTEYARARYRTLFKGLRCFSDPDTFLVTDPRYGNYLRKATVDQQGRFAFDRVYPGRYWVEATFENQNELDRDYKPRLCTSIGHVEVPDGGEAVVDFSAGPGL